MPYVFRLIAQLSVSPVHITDIECHKQENPKNNAGYQRHCTHQDFIRLLLHHIPGNDGNQIPVGLQLQRRIAEYHLLLLICKYSPARTEIFQGLGKLPDFILTVLSDRKHIKQVLDRLIAVGMGRTNQYVPGCIYYIGKTRVIIKRQGKAVHNIFHFIFLHKEPRLTVPQIESDKQVKYIHPCDAAYMRIYNSILLIGFPKLLLGFFILPRPCRENPAVRQIQSRTLIRLCIAFQRQLQFFLLLRRKFLHITCNGPHGLIFILQLYTQRIAALHCAFDNRAYRLFP